MNVAQLLPNAPADIRQRVVAYRAKLHETYTSGWPEAECRALEPYVWAMPFEAAIDVIDPFWVFSDAYNVTNNARREHMAAVEHARMRGWLPGGRP